MRKLFGMFTVFLLILFSGHAQATLWSILPECSTTESDWMIDDASVAIDSNFNGELVFHAFFKEQYHSYSSSNNIFGKSRSSPWYSIKLIFFKKSNSLKYLSVDSVACYSWDETLIHSKSYSLPYHNWAHIHPGTVGEALYHAAYRQL